MTADGRPELDQLNIVTHDVDAMVAFYRRLGLPVDDSGEDWPAGERRAPRRGPDGQRRVVGVRQRDERVDVDHGVREANGPVETVVFGFSLPSREAVDETYAELVGAGAVGRQEPYDAF